MIKRAVFKVTGKDHYEFGDITRSLLQNVREKNTIEKSSQNEVRSAFGWTDVPSGPEKPTGTSANMVEHQSKLPRLPIPPVEQTLDLYLKSIEPLCREGEYEKVKELVGEFQSSGDAEKLQTALLKWEGGEGPLGYRPPSWLEPLWDDAYLVTRDPIAVNINYYFGFEDDPIPEKNNQAGRAAGLLLGALKFYSGMMAGEMVYDFERSVPLDMSQYLRVFGASRVPKKDRDYIVTYASPPPEESPDHPSRTTQYEPSIHPDHVIFIHKNRFFKVVVIERTQGSNVVKSLEYVEACVSYILKGMEGEGSEGPPIGVFTAGDRNVWAEKREELAGLSEVNQENLVAMQSALMVVCLEDFDAPSSDELSRLICHGPGDNRWFDRHNLIVTKDGRAGINFEHSVGDGTTTLRVADEMYRYATANGHTKAEIEGRKEMDVVEQVEELVWTVNDSMAGSIKQAMWVFRDRILQHDNFAFKFERFGGTWIKGQKFSPDAFVQVAFQAAYYKMFGNVGATYEAASTRQFLHGRTETVRSCTPAAYAFAKGMGVVVSNQEGQVELLRKACEEHVANMRLAKSGKALDRHMFGLKAMSDQMGAETPALFKNDLFGRSNKWLLSTSHCGSSSLSMFGFGPVCKEGYGIGYMIKNDSICFNFTSCNTAPETNAMVYSSLLEQTLLYFYSLMLMGGKKQDADQKEANTKWFRHPTVIADQDLNEAICGY